MGIKKPKIVIMGVLNVTPDSFSDGGLYLDVKNALQRAAEMIGEGADIIDVGGQSTRPGSLQISAREELKRVLPVIKAIRKKFPKVRLSVDTYKSEVAEVCLNAGATMINSLGAFLFDSALAGVVAKYRCAVVLYHIKGRPETMQKGKITYKNVIAEIKYFFNRQIAYGMRRGIKKSQFVLDPGIGFGKTTEHNLEIIRKFEQFASFGLPVAVGVSRKSHLGFIVQAALKLKKTPAPTERVEAGLAEVAVAVLKGATIIRTHDVLATKKFLSVLERLR